MKYSYNAFLSEEKKNFRAGLTFCRKISRLLIPIIVFLLGHTVTAQDQVVSGSVLEANGDPLPGVSIAIKGTTQGTQTDANGKFTINAPTNSVLVFSFIGKISKEITVGSQTNLDISLADDLQSLQEVVVVGYGSQKKEDLTGSVVAISSKDFVQGNLVNPEQLVAGKIAGVQITNNGGAPGSGSRIRIRGGASLNASNDPLIVVDGIPLDTRGIDGASNPLGFINPNDIETFTVLKDASATAIYGSRASNGVILITTKKGKAGEALRVTFNTLASLSVNTKNIEVLSGDEFRSLVTAKGNTTQQALLGTANTNWQEQIYRQAFSSDNNLSLTGSFKNTPFRISTGYLKQNGVLKTSDLDRFSGSLGISPHFFQDHLKFDLNLKGTQIQNTFANEGAIGAAVAFDPTKSVYSDNSRFGGYYEWIDPSTNAPNTLATRNPLGLLYGQNNTSEVNRSIGNLIVDYKFHFLPALRANLNIGYDISSTKGNTFTDSTTASGFLSSGSKGVYNQKRTNRTLEFYLNYVKDLDFLSSKIDITAGYAYQDFWRKNSNSSANLKGANPINPIPFSTQNVLISFYGRLNYSILNRYLLTFTLRSDGSSRFSPETRWGSFPSAAFAWKLKEESFLKESKVVSDLKVRVGYGITGQQDVGSDYPYLARYTLSDNTAQYQFGDNYYLTYRPEGYDANIKWEQTATYNAGIDYSILDGRIGGSIDYYIKKTSNLLSVIPVAAGSNLTNQILTNVGSIENKGLEISVNTTPVRKGDFELNVGFNVTFNQSEITKLREVADAKFEGIAVGGIAGGVGNTVQIHSVGYQPNSFFVYKQVYNEQGKPIEGAYVDSNGDGKVNDLDKYRYKSPNSQMFLGFTTQIRFKQFSAGFVLRSNIGNYVYNNVYSNNGAYRNFTNPTGALSNVSVDVNNTEFFNNQYFSDYYIRNASFLRMDNITLGYNAGKFFNEKLNLRLSGNIQNAFVISKYKGLDPEVASGIDFNFYPRPRIFALGLNLGF